MLGGRHRGAGRRVDDRGGPAGLPAFEERVRVGVEEAPVPRRQLQGAVLHPEEDRTEQAEQPPVCAEAVVHALGVRADVVREALMQAEEAQVLGVGRVVDRAGAPGPRRRGGRRGGGRWRGRPGRSGPPRPRARGGASRVPPTQSRAAAPSKPATRISTASKTCFASSSVTSAWRRRLSARSPRRVCSGDGAVRAACMEEEIERSEDRPTVGPHHVLDAEGEVGGRLLGRRVDEAEAGAVEEEPDGDAGVAEEPLELRCRWVAPRTGDGLGGVEVEVGGALGEVPDERGPRRLAVGGCRRGCGSAGPRTPRRDRRRRR